MEQYDYGARFYDPVIGRWTSVDPLVEAGQESTSPYGYVFDDPVRYRDPDGRVPEDNSGCCGVLKALQQTASTFIAMQTTLFSAVTSPGLTKATFTGVDNVNNFLGIPTLTESVNFVTGQTTSNENKVLAVKAINMLMMGDGGEGESGPILHKNANNYVGHQGVYEIKMDGEVYKYGKADMTNTSATTGQPTRLQSQLNKLQRKNPDAIIEGEVIHSDENISTKDIKKVETNKVQDHINKNKKYPPGNQNHPGTTN